MDGSASSTGILPFATVPSDILGTFILDKPDIKPDAFGVDIGPLDTHKKDFIEILD